jgi:hypothetical protein
LDSKNIKCIFFGYDGSTKGDKLYNVQTKSMFINRDVIFNEGINEWEIMISQIQGHNNLWKMKVINSSKLKFPIMGHNVKMKRR